MGRQAKGYSLSIICYSFEVENWKSFFSALWRISSFSWIIQRKLSKKGKLSERQEKNLCSSWQIWLLQFKISHLFIPSRKADIEKTLEMQRMTEYWHWWLYLLVLCSFNLILKSCQITAVHGLGNGQINTYFFQKGSQSRKDIMDSNAEEMRCFENPWVSQKIRCWRIKKSICLRNQCLWNIHPGMLLSS